MNITHTAGCRDSGEEGAPETWWIGLTLSLIASLCANVGVQLQRYSMLKERKRKATAMRPYFRQPTWQLGFLVTTVTALGDFAAMGFAPQSLVTAIGASTLVSNAFLGYFWMKEPLSKKDCFATFLVVLGIVFVCLFAPRGKQCFDLKDLIRLYGEWSFVGYAVVAGVLILTMFILVKVLEAKKKKVSESSWQRSFQSRVLAFCYTALSGCIGAQSVLFAKSTAELLKNTIMGDMQLDKIGSWVIVLGMVFAIVSQVHWMARALQHADNIFVQPIFQSCFIGISSVGGLLYFQEIKELNEIQTIFFALAMMLVLVGIVMLSGRQMPKNPKQRFRAAVHASVAISRMKKCVALRLIEESSGNELTMLPGDEASQKGPHFSQTTSGGDHCVPVTAVLASTVLKEAPQTRTGLQLFRGSKYQVHPIEDANGPTLPVVVSKQQHQVVRGNRDVAIAANDAKVRQQYEEYASLIYQRIAADSTAILREMERKFITPLSQPRPVDHSKHHPTTFGKQNKVSQDTPTLGEQQVDNHHEEGQSNQVKTGQLAGSSQTEFKTPNVPALVLPNQGTDQEQLRRSGHHRRHRKGSKERRRNHRSGKSAERKPKKRKNRTKKTKVQSD